MYQIQIKYQDLLDRVRKNESLLKAYKCESNNDSERPVDKNEVDRFRLCVAIYNDYQKSDDSIIKFLLLEEITAMETVWKELQKSYELPAYLFTLNPKPEKVEILYDLKMLNYDTFCSFEREHLFANGVEETFEYLETIQTERADSIRKELRPHYSKEDISTWKKYKQPEFSYLKYPTSPNELIAFRNEMKETIEN